MSYIIEVVSPDGKSAEFRWDEADAGLPAFLSWLSSNGAIAYQSTSPTRMFVCIVLGNTKVN